MLENTDFYKKVINKATSSTSRTSILIIYTGGTIGMDIDAQTGSLIPFDFEEIARSSMEGVNDDVPQIAIFIWGRLALKYSFIGVDGR